MNSGRTRHRDGRALAKRWKITNTPISKRDRTPLHRNVVSSSHRKLVGRKRSKKSKHRRNGRRSQHVHTPRREKGLVHSDKHFRRYYSCPTSPSDLAVRYTTSGQHDGKPVCPSIDEILDAEEAEANDDGEALRRFWTAFYQLIEDLFSLFIRAVDFSKQHPRPTAIIGLIFVSYLVILYLEVSFAAIFELIIQSVWPAAKASIVVAERFSMSVAAAMDSFEDIFQGAYCDTAELWCKHFHMMCSDRCSFFEMALERMRKATPG
uniref:Uncharacterized protein n=1 Tax=Parascaris univalens TaxID=6257 RepID=A0A915AH96_PARUN